MDVLGDGLLRQRLQPDHVEPAAQLVEALRSTAPAPVCSPGSCAQSMAFGCRRSLSSPRMHEERDRRDRPRRRTARRRRRAATPAGRRRLRRGRRSGREAPAESPDLRAWFARVASSLRLLIWIQHTDGCRDRRSHAAEPAPRRRTPRTSASRSTRRAGGRRGQQRRRRSGRSAGARRAPRPRPRSASARTSRPKPCLSSSAGAAAARTRRTASRRRGRSARCGPRAAGRAARRTGAGRSRRRSTTRRARRRPARSSRWRTAPSRRRRGTGRSSRSRGASPWRSTVYGASCGAASPCTTPSARWLVNRQSARPRLARTSATSRSATACSQPGRARVRRVGAGRTAAPARGSRTARRARARAASRSPSRRRANDKSPPIGQRRRAQHGGVERVPERLAQERADVDRRRAQTRVPNGPSSTSTTRSSSSAGEALVERQRQPLGRCGPRGRTPPPPPRAPTTGRRAPRAGPRTPPAGARAGRRSRRRIAARRRRGSAAKSAAECRSRSIRARCGTGASSSSQARSTSRCEPDQVGEPIRAPSHSAAASSRAWASSKTTASCSGRIATRPSEARRRPRSAKKQGVVDQHDVGLGGALAGPLGEALPRSAGSAARGSGRARRRARPRAPAGGEWSSSARSPVAVVASQGRRRSRASA